jgi:hypothetical protein
MGTMPRNTLISFREPSIFSVISRSFLYAIDHKFNLPVLSQFVQNELLVKT